MDFDDRPWNSSKQVDQKYGEDKQPSGSQIIWKRLSSNFRKCCAIRQARTFGKYFGNSGCCIGTFAVKANVQAKWSGNDSTGRCCSSVPFRFQVFYDNKAPKSLLYPRNRCQSNDSQLCHHAGWTVRATSAVCGVRGTSWSCRAEK